MRNQRRHNQPATPTSFSGVDFCTQPIEHSSQVVRILKNGFVITSPKKLKVGSLLALRLCIPPDVSGGPFWESRCLGARVTAQRPLHGGAAGYKVELELPDKSAARGTFYF